MNKFLVIVSFIVFSGIKVFSDVITVNTNSYFTTTYTSPTTFNATNSVFTYYGFPTTNYPAAGGSVVSTIGISSLGELAKFPPIQTSFDLTGTACEIIVSPYDFANNVWSKAWFTLSDGATTTAYTNVPDMGPGHNYFVPIKFAAGGTHHLVLSLKGNFVGINVSGTNTISAQSLSKPNLLIVEGDSYTEGYNPCIWVYGYPSFWFDGWVWQLAHLQPNTIAVPSGISGTGFINSNGGNALTYGQRVVSDICSVYTSAVASGKYNQIFITASGTINDLGADTNALYAAATNVYSTLLNNCPQAHIFFVGNWLGAGGRTSPQSDDWANDTTLFRAATDVGVQYFSPIQSNVRNPGNYNVFFPAGTDSVHPSAAGYAIMAQWLNTNLTSAFGTNWNPSALNGSGTSYYTLTVNNGSGSGLYTNGQVVVLTATNIFGWYFTNWTGSTVFDAGAATTTITMPSSNVTVTANLQLIPTTSNFSVTDYGAVGDAVALTVQTTSNSPVVSVIGTNRFTTADIGKVIEVFRAGPWLYYSNNPAYGVVVTNQDTICLITNVTDGTNLWGSIPQGWTKQAYCVVGSNNRQSFQKAIDMAESFVNATNQNVTINIPDGKYLIIGSKALTPNYVMHLFDDDIALSICSGGLTLKGESTNAVLMGCGAGMNHVFNDTSVYGGYGHFNPLRGTLVQCLGPVTNSEYPLVFENLTFDGGLTNGLQGYNYFTIIEGNGEGWDTTHGALLDINPNWADQQMHQMKVFTNCVFQHWRGEILKNVTSNPGGTNTFIDIANCIFDDGNASAINLYFGQHIHGCRFSHLVKVEEYYQANATLPSVFENNVWTNIVSNPFSLVGSTINANPPSFTLRNNVFAGPFNLNQISFSPAENVFVISNTFYGQSMGVVFTGLGLQPTDGSATGISNIVVACNNFNDTYIPINILFSGVQNVWITNNVGGGGQFFLNANGWMTNVVLADNISPNTWIDTSGVYGGSYPLDMPGNVFGIQYGLGEYDNTGKTNKISYTIGRYHKITSAVASSIFYLDDTHPNLLPSGAQLSINNASLVNTKIYPSSSLSGSPAIIAPGQIINYYWLNGSWRTNQVVIKPVPPTQLQVSP